MPSSRCAVGTACISAAIGATTTFGIPPAAIDRSTLNRAAMSSALGFDSPGKTSTAGNTVASIPSDRSSSTHSSASSMCATIASIGRASRTSPASTKLPALPAMPLTAICAPSTSALRRSLNSRAPKNISFARASVGVAPEVIHDLRGCSMHLLHRHRGSLRFRILLWFEDQCPSPLQAI